MLLENYATKILLRQDEAAVGVVGEAFALSEVEKDAVLSFQIEQGLLIAENIHVTVNFLANEGGECNIPTKPAEAAAK